MISEKTGVSALVAVIGNAHGDYSVAPDWHLIYSEEINHKAGKLLVLHVVVQVLQMMILGRPYH